MEILAEEFTSAGHQVRIITQTPNEIDEPGRPYEILRLPHLQTYLKMLRWCDVCLFASVSLRGMWPLLMVSRPSLISHQTFCSVPGRFSLLGELKKLVTTRFENVACSHDLSSKISGRSIVVPNTYRSEVFREYSDVTKDRDIIFVGRLVSDKGVADLIDAMQYLRETGVRPQLSIVGNGPELSAILKQIDTLGLKTQVSLTGAMRGLELARFLARHHIMAVPSRWEEPFGIVALEGIACGCVIVGTSLGGLPEAIGPVGITVPNGNGVAIGQALKLLLEDAHFRESFRSRASAHLACHSRSAVSHRYLDILESVASR